MVAAMSEKSEQLYDDALELLQGGKLPEGIALIEESLMEDAADPQTWRLYSIALTAAGRPDDAAAAMTKAEAFGLSGADQFLVKAAEAQMVANFDAAVTHYEDALELEDGRFEIWGAYALALVSAGYEKDALEASEKACALGADEAQAWYARGRVLRLMKDMENALPAFDRAVALYPDFALACHERGMVQVELGDLDGATRSFKHVLELQPGDPAAIEALKIIEGKRG